MARMSCFPSEVWLAIFDWATFVPFALDTHAPKPFGYPGTPSHRDIWKGIQESMCTKRHLVLACREWRALATRFLYREVVITRSEALEKLLCALLSEPIREGTSDNPTTAKSNGQWVARIDMLLPTEESFPEDVFTRLLSVTPNVQTLVVAPACADPYRRIYFNEVLSLFGALAAKFAPSLRVLHVTLDGLINLCNLQSLAVPEAINGRSLRVFTFLSEDWEEDVGEPMLDLPNIEHLDIPSRWTEALLAARDVPSSLVSLPLADKRAPAKRLVEGQVLHAKDGVDTLTVTDHVPHQYWSTGPSEPLMHRIAVAFPKLRCLIVCVYYVSFAEYLPPVEKLGLRIVLHGSSEGQQVKRWETLCATIERLVTITPTVQVVRLFHRVSSDDLALRYDGVLNIVRQMSSTLLSTYNVRFEDIEGRLLHTHALEGRGEECL